jgi:hypothetical protein
MKIVYLTAGASGMYCGSCLRDGAMAAALRRLGHDVTLVPLYSPPLLEGEGGDPSRSLFYGGINVYLQHKSSVFRRTPRFLDKILDNGALLRAAF